MLILIKIIVISSIFVSYDLVQAVGIITSIGFVLALLLVFITYPIVTCFADKASDISFTVRSVVPT